MFKLAFALILSIQIFASFRDANGNFQIEWFAHNSAQVAKLVEEKRIELNDDYFFSWYLSAQINEESITKLLGDVDTKLCDDTNGICQLVEIFGYQRTLRMLYLIEVYGYNPSHLYISRDFKAPYEMFTLAEIDDVILAFTFFESDRLKRIYNKFIRTTNYSAGNSIANGRIHLFKKWRLMKREDRVAVVVHELGHNIGYLRSQYNMPQYSSYQTSKDWEDEYNSACHLSHYGKANKYEGFAEAVSMYKFNPELLKDLCPGKYSFMRRVFTE
jgi:hypothetical protein